MLKYPLDDQNRYGASIFFQKYEATSLDLTNTEGVASTLTQSALDTLKFSGKAIGSTFSAVTGIEVPDAAKLSGKKLDTSAQTGPSAEPNSKVVDEQAGLPGNCMMYLPQEINFNDGVNVNSVSLGIFGSLIERSLQGGGSLAGSFAAALGEAGSSIADVASGNASPELFAIAAGRLTQVQPTTNAAIRSATAITPNPNLRVIFEGVKLREFSFAFEMMPKSPEESEEIKRIIKYFRAGSIPESIRAGGISAGYRTPSKFAIRLKHERNGDDLAVKFKKCFLTNIATTYNGQNMTFTSDGNFQKYLMVLNFTEEQTIDRQDIEAGF